jgi:hypothetical protein
LREPQEQVDHLGLVARREAIVPNNGADYSSLGLDLEGEPEGLEMFDFVSGKHRD